MTWKTDIADRAPSEPTVRVCEYRADGGLVRTEELPAPRTVWEPVRDLDMPRVEHAGRLVLGETSHARRIIEAPILDIGAHWSDQPNGRAGWYVQVAVPADWETEPGSTMKQYRARLDLDDELRAGTIGAGEYHERRRTIYAEPA